VFLAPIGYLNAPRAIGKSLMPDPERAPIVRRVFETYASGRFTKQQVLEQTRAWGLTNRRNRPLTSQAIGMLLRNRLYAGIVDVPEYGVRSKRGDFEPLISEELFYRVQSVLSGRVPSTTPQQRAVHIRGETNIEARTVGWILDHVDDPLVPRHDTGGEQSTCLGDTVGKGRKFE
jgi:hypothetical protein